MAEFPDIPRHIFSLKELSILDGFKDHYLELTKDLNANYEVKIFSRNEKDDNFNHTLIYNLAKTRAQNDVVVSYGYMFWQRFFKKSQKDEKSLTVHFDEEVVEKSDEIGDIAGKTREVSRSIVSLSNAHQRRVIRKMLRSGKFEKLKQNVPVIEDETIYDCDCRFLKFWQKNGPRPNKNPSSFTRGYKEEIVNFGATLDLVGEFIGGNSSTIEVAEEILFIPLTGVEASNVGEFLPNDNRPYDPEVGLVSAKIWIFTLCYTRLMENYKMKEQDSHKILERYMSFIVDINRTVEEALDYGLIHRKFAKEIMSIIIKVERIIDQKVDSDTSIEKVAQQGEGLKLERERNLDNKMIAIRAGGENDWGNFVDHSYEFRFEAILDLLVECQTVLYRIRAQLKFLSEDIENRRFDPSDPNFVDLFALLVEILCYFDRSKETSKEHWANLQKVVGTMVKDVRNFIMKGFRLVRKLMEIRDMAQICTEKLNDVSNFRVYYLRHRPKPHSGSFLSCASRKKDVVFHPDDFNRLLYPEPLSRNFIENSKLEYLVIKKGDLPTNKAKAQKIEEELAAKANDEIKPILLKATEAEDTTKEFKLDREIIEKLRDQDRKNSGKEAEGQRSRRESEKSENGKDSHAVAFFNLSNKKGDSPDFSKKNSTTSVKSVDQNSSQTGVKAKK